MGGCVSTPNQNSCYNRKGTRKTFSSHVTTLQHLSSIPNRILTNGKSRTSCIFTQQGRKGINQDAMIVWDVSSILLFEIDILVFFGLVDFLNL